MQHTTLSTTKIVCNANHKSQSKTLLKLTICRTRDVKNSTAFMGKTAAASKTLSLQLPGSTPGKLMTPPAGRTWGHLSLSTGQSPRPGSQQQQFQATT